MTQKLDQLIEVAANAAMKAAAHYNVTHNLHTTAREIAPGAAAREKDL